MGEFFALCTSQHAVDVGIIPGTSGGGKKSPWVGLDSSSFSVYKFLAEELEATFFGRAIFLQVATLSCKSKLKHQEFPIISLSVIIS